MTKVVTKNKIPSKFFQENFSRIIISLVFEFCFIIKLIYFPFLDFLFFGRSVTVLFFRKYGDIIIGIFYTALGAVTIWLAGQLPKSKVMKIGPDFMPMRRFNCIFSDHASNQRG